MVFGVFSVFVQRWTTDMGVRRMARSYYKQREEEIKLLICQAKIKNKLTDAQLAKKIGMPLRTFMDKKAHPGEMRLDFLWAIEKLANVE